MDMIITKIIIIIFIIYLTICIKIMNVFLVITYNLAPNVLNLDVYDDFKENSLKTDIGMV